MSIASGTSQVGGALISSLSFSKLHVLLAEDHASTRLGIKHILAGEFRGLDLREARSAQETLSFIQERIWDLLILDLGLPDQHGLEVLGEVKRLHPALPVLIYSAHPESQYGPHALRLGASGYLSKEESPQELCAAVRVLLAGGQYFNRLPAARLSDSLAIRFLSKREFEVFCLTAAGKPGKTMAAELGLSQKTISTYRTRILRKLRLATTADLIHYAIREGLV